jgi:hypothetical protein
VPRSDHVFQPRSTSSLLLVIVVAPVAALAASATVARAQDFERVAEFQAKYLYAGEPEQPCV